MSNSGNLSKLGAIHPMTGRQWELGRGETWPDVEIVIPFGVQVTDNTATIIGPVVSSPDQGGYVAYHSLNKLELFDLINERIVPNVKGVWACGSGGSTTRLHLLAQDPFSWLIPHGHASSTVREDPPVIIEQFFGLGNYEVFVDERRFHEMLLKPTRSAELITLFHPIVQTRLMKCNSFTLKFRTADNKPIDIDELTLVVVGKMVYGAVTFVAPPILRPLYGDLGLLIINVPLSAPVNEIQINLGDQSYLIYSIRYREARKTIVEWSEKTILVPGKYRITVEGESQATSPHGLPPSKKTKWHVQQEFGVNYPETLRPYIQYSSLGDSRIFATGQSSGFDSFIAAWDPSLLGLGFPHYKKYHAVVRFNVPYLDQIFSKLELTLKYDGHLSTSGINETLNPIPNSYSESSLPEISQKWIIAAGGTIKPDEEIILASEFPQNGTATVSLSFKLSNENIIKLDEWSCCISSFENFTHHLFWKGNYLQTYYNAAGEHVIPLCHTMVDKGFANRYKKYLGKRIDPLPRTNTTTIKTNYAFSESGVLAAPYPKIDHMAGNQELTSPPLDWRLSNSLTEHIKPLNAHTGLSFSRFAHESGARFNSGSGDKLDSIQDTVEETTMEAILAHNKRLLALWIRTPEPVDWRRVGAELTIRHILQSEGCPTGYVPRKPLTVQISILPSPDGSSAFLIGKFAGIFTELPRGEFEIAFLFDPAKPGLPRLRPFEAEPEIVKMKFIQPFGEDWPTVTTRTTIPAGVLEKLVRDDRPPLPPNPEDRHLQSIQHDKEMQVQGLENEGSADVNIDHGGIPLT